MATSAKPVKNRAYTFIVSLIDAAAIAKFKSSPTIAAGDFKVGVPGGAFTNLATLPTVMIAGGPAVLVTLNASEMNQDNLCILAADQAGAEWCDAMWSIETKDPSYANFPFVMRDLVGQEAPAASITAQYSYDSVTWASLAGTITNDGNGDYRIPIPIAIAAGYTDFLRLRFTAPGCQTTKLNLLNTY